MANTTALNNIRNRLKTAPTFKPSSMTGFTDWALQAGDVVSVSNSGDSYTMPIYNSTMEWRGAPYSTVDCTGDEERDELVNVTSRATAGRVANTEAWQDQVDVQVGKIDGGWAAIVQGAKDGTGAATKWAKITITPESIQQSVTDYNTNKSTYVTTTSDSWSVVSSNAAAGKAAADKWASITVTPTQINQNVTDYKNNKSTYVINTSDQWKLVSEDSSAGREAANKWSQVSVTPTQIKHTVTNLVNKTGLMTKQTTDGWGIYKIDYSAENPTETALLTVGELGINLGDYAKVSQISAVKATIQDLTVTKGYAYTLYAKGLITKELEVMNKQMLWNVDSPGGGDRISARKRSVVTSVSGGTVTTKNVHIVYENGIYYFVDSTGSKSSTIPYVTNNVAASATKKEIVYLGMENNSDPYYAT